MHQGPRPIPSLEPAIQHAWRQAMTYQIHVLPDWPYRQPREQERERWKRAASSSARSPLSRSSEGSDFSSRYGFRLLITWAKRPWAVTGSPTSPLPGSCWRIDPHDCDIQRSWASGTQNHSSQGRFSTHLCIWNHIRERSRHQSLPIDSCRPKETIQDWKYRQKEAQHGKTTSRRTKISPPSTDDE